MITQFCPDGIAEYWHQFTAEDKMSLYPILMQKTLYFRQT